MAAKNKRRRVQRLSEWDRSRYSVIPADVWLDRNLTLIHYKLLAALGRVNTELGWCELSQTNLAKLVGATRTTLSAAVNDLVRWRYVEMRSQKQTKSAFCHYRTLLDDPYFEAEDEYIERHGTSPDDVSAAGDTPSEGDVSATGDTPENCTCRPERTPVSATDDTGVAESGHPHNKNARATRSEIKDQSPPNPRKRGRREVGWIDQLRREKPGCSRAVDKLLAPLLTRVKFSAPNPPHALAMLAEWIEQQTDEVIEDAYRMLSTPGDETHYRGFDVRPPNIETAVHEARKLAKGREALRNSPLLFRGTPEFNAAMAKLAAVNPLEAEYQGGREIVKRADIEKRLNGGTA